MKAALNNFVVLKKLKGAPKQIAGLEVVEAVDTEGRYVEGEVHRVPEQFKEALKEGEVVIYDKVAGHDIRYEDVVYRLVRIGDIALVL